MLHEDSPDLGGFLVIYAAWGLSRLGRISSDICCMGRTLLSMYFIIEIAGGIIDFYLKL
jgi:hypothetical protein